MFYDFVLQKYKKKWKQAHQTLFYDKK